MDFVADGSETQPFCYLCGDAAGRVRYKYAGWNIVICHRCGLWRCCPRPSAAELVRVYQEKYYSAAREATGQYDAWKVANLDVWRVNAGVVRNEARRRGLGEGGTPTVLDVGCGHGFFMEQCLKLGLRARGLEPSPDAAAYARTKLKLDVRQIALDELAAEERYDVITLWGVLEHVPDPLRTMQQVRAHLRPGGMTWVMTPNTAALDRFRKGGNWFNFVNRTHLTHFHRRTLRALLLRAGLQNVHRYIHWGGGNRRGLSALAQYFGRVLCVGTELRFVADTLSPAGERADVSEANAG